MPIPKTSAVRQRTAPVSHRHKPWTVLSAMQGTQTPTPVQVPLTRRYEVSWVDDHGQLDSFIRVAPAMPIFEEAFSAFTHGAVIPTTEGPVPVEDLEPGMAVETASGEIRTLRWVGAITLVPGASQAGDLASKVYRVTADAFGLGRPATDVTFGPAARLLNRDPAIRNALGCEAALAPIASAVDGVSVIEMTPVSPVRVYHLAFDGHHVIRTGGLEVETYHPGQDAHYSMSRELRDVFLSLFPHVETMQGFGRVMWPRFTEQEDGLLEIV
ncbi:MAG: Hint domain-containing protein [Pseudomonadota bacterium]